MVKLGNGLIFNEELFHSNYVATIFVWETPLICP